MRALLQDTRIIKQIALIDSTPIRVGEDSVEKIEVYEELGFGSYIPWFLISYGDSRGSSRVNSSIVASVIYF